MVLNDGDKFRGHIAKGDEILYRDAPVVLKVNPTHSTPDKRAFQFDIFPPEKPELSVDEVCHLRVNDEQIELRVIESRPFTSDTFVLCFLCG